MMGESEQGPVNVDAIIAFQNVLIHTMNQYILAS